MSAAPISRRSFLATQASMLSLPVLSSLAMGAKPSSAPKRFIFLAHGWGGTEGEFLPSLTKPGALEALPANLAPLERHRESLTFVQNTRHKHSHEAHWGSTFWLTGADQYAIPGRNFHNSISADQIIAGYLGTDTRFGSVQIGCANPEPSGHGPGLSLAWNSAGKPVSGVNSPYALYQKLFGVEDRPIEEQKKQFEKKQTVLDALAVDANALSGQLGETDRDKLQEYVSSVQDIETSLSKELEWIDVPKPRPDGVRVPPKGLGAQEGKEIRGEHNWALNEFTSKGTEGEEEIRLVYQMIVAAMKVDSSRVFTYRQPVEGMLKDFGGGITGHNMSHLASEERREMSRLRDRKQAELLAELIDQLKAWKEPDGSTLFDNTTLVFGSNIQTRHNLTNCPTLVTGGGSHVRLGQNFVSQEKDTPLCNVWLTLMQGAGLEVNEHGDSTGIIGDLLMS